MLKRVTALYREAYAGLPVSVWMLALVMFVNRAGTVVMPFLSIYLIEKKGFSIEDAGWLMSIAGAGAVMGALLGGKLADMLGYRAIQVAGLLLGGIFFIVVMVCEGFWPTAVALWCQAVSFDMFRPANGAAVAVLSPPDRLTQSWALNRLAANLGYSFGPMLGGMLLALDAVWLFWLDAITCWLAAGLFYVTVWHRLPGGRQHRSARTRSLSEHPAGKSPYRPHILLFVLIILLNSVCFMQYVYIFPVYMRQTFAWPESWVGLMLGLNGAQIVLLEMILVSRLQHKSILSLISAGTMLIMLAYIVLWSTSGPWWLMIAIIILTFGEMLTMPFMNTFLIRQSNETNRASYTGLQATAYALSHILAPLYGTTLVGTDGHFDRLWVTTITLSGLCSLTIWWMQKTAAYHE